MQKLLINSVGERDYSAQETCHLLLQLPMFKASRDFIVLNLDGSRAVEDRLEEAQHATVPSLVDHYVHRPNNSLFNDRTLLEFTRQYTTCMPKTVGSEPSCRNKSIVVIPCPYCSPDPTGPKYQQYCRQSLMQHKSFRQLNGFLDDSESYVEAYASFLQCGLVSPCLEEDIHRLQQQHADQISEECSDPEVCVLACIILYTCTRLHIYVCTCMYIIYPLCMCTGLLLTGTNPAHQPTITTC